MDVSDAIITVVKIAGNNILGRTAIQKIVYFLSVFEIVDVKYRPHYYGPYSADVASSTQMLASIDFLKETVETTRTTGYTVPENWKKYHYSLSSDGEQFVEEFRSSNAADFDKISRVVEICRDTVNFNPEILSWAAKVSYILSKKKEPMTYDAITSTASSFGWDLSSEQIEMALELLQSLGLSK
ncbi:MAG: hypothetical protein WA130_15900 [Candidatus Methanoperedens sp.]